MIFSSVYCSSSCGVNGHTQRNAAASDVCQLRTHVDGRSQGQTATWQHCTARSSEAWSPAGRSGANQHSAQPEGPSATDWRHEHSACKAPVEPLASTALHIPPNMESATRGVTGHPMTPGSLLSPPGRIRPKPRALPITSKVRSRPQDASQASSLPNSPLPPKPQTHAPPARSCPCGAQ